MICVCCRTNVIQLLIFLNDLSANKGTLKIDKSFKIGIIHYIHICSHCIKYDSRAMPCSAAKTLNQAVQLEYSCSLASIHILVGK